METKTISLDEDAFKILELARLYPEEPFSNVVRRGEWPRPEKPFTNKDLLAHMAERARKGELLEESTLAEIEADIERRRNTPSPSYWDEK